MKICQLSAVDFTVEKFLLPLIDEMKKNHWEVTIVCSNGNLVEDIRKKGYTIDTIPIPRSKNPIKAIRTIYLLFKYFKKNKFDIIHFHTPVASLLGRIAAKISCDSYLIYTAHGFYFHDEMNYFAKSFFINLEKFAGHFTNLLFCQSDEDSQTAIIEKIMVKQNIITIGNGVDINKYDYKLYEPYIERKKNEFNIPNDAKVIGIIARMVVEKGYREFITAAINLHQIYPNIYFLVIGGRLDSDHNKGIDDLLILAKNKLSHQFINLGFRSDIPSLISIMDIFCLPSYREGLPRTIIEAMFLKKPVIATNIRGCREEVIHDKTGLLIPVADSNSLFNALKHLIKNEDLSKKMGEAGYNKAIKHYNESEVIKIQINTIKERFYSKA